MRKNHPRNQILAIQKKIYQDNQRHINDTTEVTDPQFKAYERRYQRAVSSYRRRVSIPDVVKKMQASRVVIVGDYHTLDQSQRSFVRVLRSFAKVRRPLVVALECITVGRQKVLDAFMRGEVSEKDFAKMVAFRKRWFFDLWQNYRVVFDWLKENRIPVYGIESDDYDRMTLADRDDFMAGRIAMCARAHPGATVCVLVGDLHLAPTHLPRALIKASQDIAMKISPLILYQNSPAIYWQLSKRGVIDEIMVVQIEKNAYCRIHTPPIIAQQSYLNWLYHDEGQIDWIDAKASFLEILSQIARIIEVKLPNGFDDIDVYTCGDVSFLSRLSRAKKMTKKELAFLRSQALHSESFFWAKKPLVYIANVSINHAAEEASHYLKYLLTGDEKPRSNHDAFYANVLHEAVGFFGSKLVNAKRKSPRLIDFKRELIFLEKSRLATKRSLEYETARLFIAAEILARKKKSLPIAKIRSLPSQVFMALSHAMGYDLGDRLYYALMQGKVASEQIKYLYTSSFSGDGAPGKLYLELMQKLARLRRPEKV